MKKDERMKVKGDYMEVWEDMMGYVGVIEDEIIIYMNGWEWVD